MAKTVSDKFRSPVNELRPSVPHYMQGTSDYACGPACICMCLDYLLLKKGRPRMGYEDIKNIERLTMDRRIWSSLGTSCERMKKAIRSIEFGCREVHGTSDKTMENNLRQALYRHPIL
jgi:predicted double-glycine peptidase